MNQPGGGSTENIKNAQHLCIQCTTLSALKPQAPLIRTWTHVGWETFRGLGTSPLPVLASITHWHILSIHTSVRGAITTSSGSITQIFVILMHATRRAALALLSIFSAHATLGLLVHFYPYIIIFIYPYIRSLCNNVFQT